MLESGSGDNKDHGVDSVSTRPFEEGQEALINNDPNGAFNQNAPGSRDSSGGLVVARGTGDGLILRLDGRVERPILMKTLLEYVESRKSFFSGQEVTLEWVEARPEEGVVAELSDSLASKYQLLVKASRMFERGNKSTSGKKSLSSSIERDEFSSTSSLASRIRPSPVTPKIAERAPSHPISGHATTSSHGMSNSSYSASGTASTSLFDGVTALSGTPNSFSNNTGYSSSPSFGASSTNSQDRRTLTSEALLWDEADTRIIRDTLRGGQKIESEHSVVIMGDVNSGAEIVAGGDIFVLGRLRGVAHAGAYDESGAGRRIFALQMQPTQLRIGSIISQGSEEGGRMPEVAKIEGNMIVVEPYGAGSQVKRLSR